MIYTRTTQEWQWLLGKLWYGSYRWRPVSSMDSLENPFVITINLIQSKLHVGNPVDRGITVDIPPALVEDMGPDYADAIRRSGTIGRRTQHDLLPELLEHVPGEDFNSRSRPEDV